MVEVRGVEPRPLVPKTSTLPQRFTSIIYVDTPATFNIHIEGMSDRNRTDPVGFGGPLANLGHALIFP